jgi:hypothetical protein
MTVREVCHEFPGHPGLHPGLIHWSIPSPAREGSTDQKTYPAYLTKGLAARILFLLELIASMTPAQEVT